MRRTAFLTVLLAFTALHAGAAPVAFTGTADTAAGIQLLVDVFRSELGALNSGVCSPTPCASGRREINWDGVPSSDFDPFPGDFFNGDGSVAARARGLSMVGASSSFAVSDTAFGAPGGFQTFSPNKMFAAKGSGILDIYFHVPGQPSSSAEVMGMGIIFLDVESPDRTSMSFLTASDVSLGTFYAPAGNNAGFSFLGVLFTAGEKVARVRVATGDGGIDTCSSDCVAMDDFIYSEPQGGESARVPEPSTFSLLLGGAALLALCRRRSS